MLTYKNFLLKRRMEEEHYSKWLDEDLDSDAVDLEGYGFLHGYFEELEV